MQFSKVDYRWTDKIKKIYLSSFPRNERKSLGMIRRCLKKGKYDLFVLNNGDDLYGFMLTVPYDDIVMLDYLAVDGAYRGKGYGAILLEETEKAYAGKRLLLIAEEIDESKANNKERIRRIGFYTHHDWKVTDMLSVGWGRFHILTYGGDVTKAEYDALQLYTLGRFLLKLTRIHAEDINTAHKQSSDT